MIIWRKLLIASTHLAVGAAVGLSVQKCLSVDTSDPQKLFWAFVAGFASHLLLDAFPHQEYRFGGVKLGAVLFIEILTIFVLLLSSSNYLLTNAVIFFGMAGGAIPDMIELAYSYFLSWSWLNNLGRIIHFFHFKSQTYNGFVFDFYSQVIIAIIAVVLVRFKAAS